jgi:hypothetical protein
MADRIQLVGIDRLRVDRGDSLKLRQASRKGPMEDTTVLGSGRGYAVRLNDVNAFNCVKIHYLCHKIPIDEAHPIGDSLTVLLSCG